MLDALVRHNYFREDELARKRFEEYKAGEELENLEEVEEVYNPRKLKQEMREFQKETEVSSSTSTPTPLPGRSPCKMALQEPPGLTRCVLPVMQVFFDQLVPKEAKALPEPPKPQIHRLHISHRNYFTGLALR